LRVDQVIEESDQESPMTLFRRWGQLGHVLLFTQGDCFVKRQVLE